MPLRRACGTPVRWAGRRRGSRVGPQPDQQSAAQRFAAVDRLVVVPGTCEIRQRSFVMPSGKPSATSGRAPSGGRDQGEEAVEVERVVFAAPSRLPIATSPARPPPVNSPMPAVRIQSSPKNWNEFLSRGARVGSGGSAVAESWCRKSMRSRAGSLRSRCSSMNGKCIVYVFSLAMPFDGSLGVERARVAVRGDAERGEVLQRARGGALPRFRREELQAQRLQRRAGDRAGGRIEDHRGRVGRLNHAAAAAFTRLPPCAAWMSTGRVG